MRFCLARIFCVSLPLADAFMIDALHESRLCFSVFVIPRALTSLSNCETEIGQKVALVHVDAPEGWYRVPEGFECWKEVLADAGYTDGEVRP